MSSSLTFDLASLMEAPPAQPWQGCLEQWRARASPPQVAVTLPEKGVEKPA